ncbi:glycoside hydrolase family 57 protein [Methylicorpusculum sp.]|uniref:glycoside hydrolase family 57 protein n=1 Tax=Methylicorpusculum sp. TaxID=2713644 RepID=UPI00271B974C|nr:glycoside hydrolase family 57 protein [Methylicorpusculum sp.]MDO8843919.1 glycoside hydrolase family 57 protein [Methylicorpusculum sp.]
MSDSQKLKLVLCWHMHQPEYRDLQTGEYQLPWTYLHVLKDYSDMAAHLEAVPEARAVVNFAPILLEQIEDYAKQVNGFLREDCPIKDPMLSALVAPSVTAEPEGRLKIIHDCVKANRARQIERYPAYLNLVVMADWVRHHDEALSYLSPHYFEDLLVWYHLAWMGESIKLADFRIQKLIDKGSGFTHAERIQLAEVIGEHMDSIIGRYKRLAEQGRVELSVTPYAHPIMPLMLEIQSALQAMPDAVMPQLESYPGGKERVKWHLQYGLDTFKRFFGFVPQGCWPSEGAVSAETLSILSEYGFKWAASGGNVLRNSLHLSELEAVSTHHPFCVDDTGLPCFFRDDGLSDLIGFEYSKWHADDAVADLIKHLEFIHKHDASIDKVVSIIMDGENAWEYFPQNGYYFLSALYQKLSSHPDIELTTFSACLDQVLEVKPLPKMMAGSWVYGTFSTWIGDKDKNRGWDMLGDVKLCYDQLIASGHLSPEQIEAAQQQLAICEGSDWFWWFGDYNPGDAVSSFERQYRLNLTNLYRLMGQEPPAYLAQSFAHGSGDPAMGGAMRPGLENL